MKVSDLVQIPPVRTVVRLADLYDHTLRRGMVERAFNTLCPKNSAVNLWNISRAIADI